MKFFWRFNIPITGEVVGEERDEGGLGFWIYILIGIVIILLIIWLRFFSKKKPHPKNYYGGHSRYY